MNWTKPSEELAVSVAQDGDIMARKKVDKLAQDVHQAIAAGMSYGRWKAMQEPVKIEKSIPKGWKVCPQCGKQFKPHHGQQKYCEIYCREQAYVPKTREMQRAYYIAKRKEK